MQPIPFARPSIGEREIAAVTRVLRSGWLTTGAEALAFEQEFAAAVDSAHALAVTSATAGLHLALEAVGTRPGDTVVVPSLTFTATAEVARYLGAELVFADVEADSLLMDPRDLERRIDAVRSSGGRVAAVIPVHLAGEACRMHEICSVAGRQGIPVIEDAAHAFPGSVNGAALGTIGDLGVYSFYANKTITTGEGGMVVTDNPDYARRVALMRNHGIDREAWTRYTDAGVDPGDAAAAAVPAWYYEVVAAGYKYNLPDTAAALGRVQLERSRELYDARKQRADRYSRELAALADRGLLTLPRPSPGHAWHLYVIRLRQVSDTRARDALIEELRNRRIGTSVHYIPLHRMPYWNGRYPHAAASLPHTEARFREIVSLPLYPDLSDEDQSRVIAALYDVLGSAPPARSTDAGSGGARRLSEVSPLDA